MQPLCAFAFHAERLEDDDVWEAVRMTAAWMQSRGVPLTFFVHPLTAIEAGVDLTPRLAQLADGGHEIAQHTHFYAEHHEGPRGLVKRTDLGEGTVIRCLSRDFEYLVGAGFRPRGFVAGGWAISPVTFDWLEVHGFRYDCSYRTFGLRYPNAMAAEGDDAPGPFWRGHVLEIPTTAPLSDEIRRPWTAHAASSENVRFRIGYMHDTDLIKRGRGMALRRCRTTITRGYVHVTVGEIASCVEAESDEVPRE